MLREARPLRRIRPIVSGVCRWAPTSANRRAVAVWGAARALAEDTWIQYCRASRLRSSEGVRTDSTCPIVTSEASTESSRTRELPHVKRKVFISRKSLLDELMEVQHFRTIYHMFIAGLCVLIISTLAIDLIDEGRLMLEFDLLIFSFGQLPLALMTWVPMFLSTLLVPYQTLRLWARPSTGGTWMLGAGLGCALLAAHGAMLCILPVHVAVKHQLPPASKCVLVFEQALGCVLYACFILARLCVPVFANMSREPFSTRALLLSILHATGPGIFMLLLIFFAFLHCWLNAFAEMLRFGDRMFYRVRLGLGPTESSSWGG
ncbi:sterol O-acyltransferase 2 [Cricetulus griseus]